MPELPEVETTRRGLAPHLKSRSVAGVTLRRPDLRWPIPPEIKRLLPGERIRGIRRRATITWWRARGAGRSAIS